MSITRLPRELGIIIRCDGTDKEHCCLGEKNAPMKFQTANVFAKHNRAYAALHGWGRGLRRGKKRNDHCPAHMEIERKLFEEAKAKAAAEKAARHEKLKAMWTEQGVSPAQIAARLAPKPRKKKNEPEHTFENDPDIQALTRVADKSSPSADSAPAAST